MHLTLNSFVAVLTFAVLLSACGQRDAKPDAEVPQSSQSTVPPPPGDSTPKAADATTRTAVEANEKGAAPTTMGTAASGAPPYTIGSAPEGNTAPSRGTSSNEPPKK